MTDSLPEWARFLFGIASTLLTIILGYIATATRKVVDSQHKQEIATSQLSMKVDHINEKVNNIHEWKNDQQKAQTKKDMDRIHELQDIITQMRKDNASR